MSTKCCAKLFGGVEGRARTRGTAQSTDERYGEAEPSPHIRRQSRFEIVRRDQSEYLDETKVCLNSLDETKVCLNSLDETKVCLNSLDETKACYQ